MAWVPDVSNCTEKPEPTSSVSGPGSYNARLATRNHDMRGAERLHRKQNVLRRHHGPSVGILGLDHHVGYRYPPLWIGRTNVLGVAPQTSDRTCPQTYEHGRCARLAGSPLRMIR